MPAEKLKLRDIVVLALLSEAPRYGYEIKTIIDTVMSHIIDISSGSLYYGIKKLEQQGYLEEASTEKVGRRPERSVYRITEHGTAALARELPKVIFPEARPVFPINLALYFFDQIPAQEQARRLKMRWEYLEFVEKMLLNLLAAGEKQRPVGQMAIIRHHCRYVEMERDFITELLQSIADGSAYELDSRDRDEIQREFDNLLGRLKQEDAAQARGSGSRLEQGKPSDG